MRSRRSYAVGLARALGFVPVLLLTMPLLLLAMLGVVVPWVLWNGWPVMIVEALGRVVGVVSPTAAARILAWTEARYEKLESGDLIIDRAMDAALAPLVWLYGP